MVQLVRSGRTPGELSREFDPTRPIHLELGEAAERDAAKRVDGPTIAEREELMRLRRESVRLRQERDILSMSAAWFARESNANPSGFFRFMSAHQASSRSRPWPVSSSLRVRLLRLARQASFAGLMTISIWTRRIRNDPRRLARNLRRASRPCRVQGRGRRHRQEAGGSPDAGGWAHRRQPAQDRDDDSTRSRDRPANDLVRRNFFVGKPNELRVAAITLVPTLAGSCSWLLCWTPGRAGSSLGLLH